MQQMSTADADRPRERLIRHGSQALSTQELLALLINVGTPGASAAEIANDVLRRFPTLTDLAGRDVAELRAIHGMGTAKAATLCAAFELAHRIQAEPFSDRTMITSPAVLAKLMAPRMRHLRTECFHVVLLNSANQVMRDVAVSDGSLNAVLIHPREVFRLAIAENCAAVILVHNHPSGNTEPSKEDITITRQLVDAGRIVDIRVLDHIIIGGDAYTSLAERHLM
ncbi:MAG: DNA repair protein RadC [Ignavibacteria bacterium]|nr:DNA repair protein RadC [Ignavibacteria bacterium]MBK6419729.1 DNA repair protein RadC [Ignavibacteria bacterium]MBK6759639.1 DNA repair protein RadC [Ignavibacteria bacterium]MBK7184533.1 DNA repair protein RadC [Ignavibacteria bacterium]